MLKQETEFLFERGLAELRSKQIEDFFQIFGRTQ